MGSDGSDGLGWLEWLGWLRWLGPVKFTSKGNVPLKAF